MSTQVENPTAPQDETVNVHRKFLAHINKYPLANETKDAFLSIPYTKRVTESIVPTLQVVRETNPFKLVIDQGDIVADGTLNQVDRFVPTLQTITYSDLTTPITRPIHGTVEGAQKVLGNVNQTIHKNVTDPTVKFANDVRQRVSHLMHDEQGKGIVTSHADPLVAPINENLEKVVEKYFPKTKKVSKDHSSELSRTVRIVSNVVFRVHGTPSAPTESNQAPEVPDANQQGASN